MSRKDRLVGTLVLAAMLAAGTLTVIALLADNPVQIAKLFGAAEVVLGGVVLMLLAIVAHRQLRLAKISRDQISALGKAESRHDYNRKFQMDQHYSVLKRLRFLSEGISGFHTLHDPGKELSFEQGSDLPRVLFVTSNGAGMGHLTRCMAVALSGRRLFQGQFVSLSSSAEVVRLFGFDVLRYPSQMTTNLDIATWNDNFSAFFDEVCRVNQPQAIVFDGTWIYRGVHEAAQRHGAKLIWLRRGLWKATSDVSQLDAVGQLADHVLVPRDVGDFADKGPVAGLQGVAVPAPVLTRPHDFLSREAALAELGLDATKNYVLVQLGAGAIDEASRTRDNVIDHILASDPSAQVVVGLSPLSRDYTDDRSRVHVVRRYPLAKYLAAFTYMVIAAGFNSVHESVRFRIPAIVVPNLQTSTDNQVLRAAEYQRQGFGLSAIAMEELMSAIDAFNDSSRRADFLRALESADLPIDSGEGAAKEIQQWLNQSQSTWG